MATRVLGRITTSAATSSPPSAIDRWQRFWFAEIPANTSALLRMVFGMLGILGLLGLTPVTTFWALTGIAYLSGSMAELKTTLLNWNLGTIAGVMLFAALFVSFVAMTLGYLTRAAVGACFLGSVLQNHWNPLPLSAGSQVVTAVLFGLVWIDCGAVWSVDAWLRARRATDADHSVSAPNQPIWPLYLIRIQIAIVYFSTGLWKLVFGSVWRDGSAIHFVLHQNAFSRLPVSLSPAFDPLLTATTYLTLFWELSFPVMVLHRWTRRLALAVGLGLHLGMWVTMEVGLFSWIMIGSYVAFLDPNVASNFFRVRNCAQASKGVRPTVELATRPNQA